MLHKVLDEVNVLLPVLDAHDPPWAAPSWSRRKCTDARRRTSGSCSCSTRSVCSRLSPSPYTLQHSWIDLMRRENAQVFTEAPPPHDPNDGLPPVGSRARTIALASPSALHRRSPPSQGVQDEHSAERHH